MKDDQKYALTHLYHPGTGAKVDIPIDLDNPITARQAEYLIDSIDNLIRAGFTVNLPGLEDGENFEQIGFVVRREKENEDGSVTPIIDLYPVQGNFRILGIYLNTQADIAEFETACGVKVASLPVHDGTPIERGKKPSHDAKVIALKSPAKLVYKQNPKWEGDTDKKHSKRLFVRWEGLRPTATETNGTSPIQPAMTYEQAQAVKSPAGAEFRTLDAEKLNAISISRAANVTDEMRQAATIILNEMKLEGA